jgi:hypothetical protein
LEKFADDYLSRGWSVIPVQHKGKQPTLKDWTQSQITLDTLDKHFKAEPRNIGICLGEASGGLVDVDLDWPEAASLAQYILPSTGAVFGRPGSPASHRLYICQGIDRRESYRDPTKSAGKGMIVEIRTDRCQTVVPPSVHETGEDIEWETADVAPATVEPEQLRRAIARLAAVSLLARYWPAGSRQDATLPLAGALLRGGMPEDEAREFIKRVAEAAGDDEVDKRVGAVDDTARNLKANEPVTGLPRLVDFFGQPVVDCIADWLGLGGDTHDVIADLNENHAMVLVGGQASILKEKISPEGRPEIEMISPSAFKTYYCNKMVSVDDKTISIANHWITHRDRRSYEGLVFMPGATPQNYYNLWRGFAVEPRRGAATATLTTSGRTSVEATTTYTNGCWVGWPRSCNSQRTNLEARWLFEASKGPARQSSPRCSGRCLAAITWSRQIHATSQVGSIHTCQRAYYYMPRRPFGLVITERKAS